MNSLISSVLTGVAANLIVGELHNAPDDVPRFAVWCLAVRISPAHWRETYTRELQPKLMEACAAAGPGWSRRLRAGLGCAAALWRAETSRHRSRGVPAPDLARDENVIVVVRRHPIVLVPPLLGCLAGLAAATAVTLAAHAAAGVIQGAWLGCGLLLGWLVFRVQSWLTASLAFTPRRVSLVSGIFWHHVSVLPLAQISDVTLHQSLAGRLLGYGRMLITVTRPGLPDGRHPHPLGEIDYVPYPHAVIAELRTLLDPHPLGEPG